VAVLAAAATADRYIAEAVRVCKIGGHVAIYHRVQPPTPKGPDHGVPVVRLARRIVILTRAGHAPRVCFVFEKVGA
jgi:hypothetical protein